MVNKTADCFNNILFWSWKLIEKIYWKNRKQLNVGKDLMSCYEFNRNAELLRLVGATFYSKVASLRRMMKKNLIILKRKLLLMAIFCFICFVVVDIWVVKYQLKVFGTYLYDHLTYLYDSVVFEIFLNIITIYLLLNNN